jgi:hypothetical protein
MRLAATLRILLPWLVCVCTQAADARFVQVGKGVWYTQTGTGAPVLQANGYQVRARVDATKADAIGAVSLKWPSPIGNTRSLSNEVTFWEFSQRFSTMEAMNFAAPNGTYTMITQGALDGKRTNMLTISADVYPNLVHIANFSAAQKVNAKADFTLQWDPPGTGAGDIIQVRVFANDQIVFETGFVPGAAGTLNGSATSCVIPKNTLAEAAVFRGQVIATRKSTSDATGYPGVPAWAFYSRATEFTVRTAYPTLDVNWYGIAKIRRFTQNSVLAPVPAAAGAFGFSAFTFATDPLNVQNVSLKLPNAKMKVLTANGANWTAAENFDGQAQLDAAYVIGPYELNIQTLHNSLQKLPLPLASASFPLPIQISNWNEASALDSTRTFALKWLPLAGGTADDFVQVTVTKNGKVIFRTSDFPGAAGVLDGRATSVNLPAGLLLPGEAAEVTLNYLKSVSSDPFSYPQSLGTVACGCETRATIRAAGGNIAAAQLTGARVSNGILEFNLTCTEGRQQIIQVSRDLIHWSDVLVTNAPAGSFLLRFGIDKLAPAVTVRVRTN